MDKYSISIQWSDEDKGYIATVPELKGLSAFGTSKEDALNELESAKKAYLEVFNEDGCELPEPETVAIYSGQTRLRLPKSLHAYLSKKAKKENVSLNTLIVSKLSQDLNSESMAADFKTAVEDLKAAIAFFHQKSPIASWEFFEPKPTVSNFDVLSQNDKVWGKFSAINSSYKA